MSATRALSPCISGPYKGLNPFDEEDSPFFFGRDADSEIVLANLLGSRLTVLYAASGVGKSSLLGAGVAAKLHASARMNLADDGAPGLAVVTVRRWQGPPLDGLLQATRAAVCEALGSELETLPPASALTESLRSWSTRLEGDILIVLDQFEDYFFYHAADEGPGSFAAELASAVNATSLGAHFLISIRDDAIARLDRFKGLIPTILDHSLRLEHLDRAAAREAIEGPIASYNSICKASYKVQEELIEAVLEGVSQLSLGDGGRGALAEARLEERIQSPYLQLVMSRLWEAEAGSGSHLLRRRTLDDLGGIERIVRRHLDTRLAALSASERRTAAEALRYLVTPSGAKSALGVDDLAQYTGRNRAQLDTVLRHLSLPNVRILLPVADRTGAQRYEIFHDALAGPVRDWLQRFLGRRLLRLRLGVVVLTLLLAATLGTFAWWAWWQWRLATAGRFASEAMYNLEASPDLALLLGVQAHRYADMFATRNTLLQMVQAKPRLRGYLWGKDLGAVSSLAFSPDGRVLVAGGDGGALEFWDVGQRRSRGRRVMGVPGNPDGKLLAAAYARGPVVLWDDLAAHRPRRRSLPESGADALAFSPDGEMLLVSVDEELSAWSVKSWPPAQRPLRINRGRPSVDGRFVISATTSETGDQALHVTDTQGRPVGSPLVVAADKTIVAKVLAADSSVLVVADDDGFLTFWSLKNARKEFFESGLQEVKLATSRNGRMLAVAGGPNTVRAQAMPNGTMLMLLDLEERTPPGERLQVDSDSARLSTLAPSSDGHLLATTGTGLGLHVLDLRQGGLAATSLAGKAGKEWYAQFTADGGSLLVADSQGQVLRWQVREGRPPVALFNDPHSGSRAAAFSPAGHVVAFAYDDAERTVILWDMSTRQPIETLAVSQAKAALVDVVFSPDGRLLALSDKQKDVYLWDLDAHRMACKSPAARTDLNLPVLAFSPDGAVLASGTADDTVVFLDVKNCRQFGRPLTGHDAPITALSFSPDAKTLASTDLDHTVRLWDVAGRRPLFERLIHPHGGESVAFAPGGKMVFSGGMDGSVYLWDVSPESWERRSCRRVGRNLSLREWRQQVGPFLPYERTCPELLPGDLTDVPP